MATKKKSLKKDGPILVLRTEEVPVKSLKPYHKNPRIGDVDAIAESLESHGQFRPIVVNVGTHTGRENEIIAGNHTWLGTRKLGRDSILASFIDVDEEKATRIVLADNALADKGTYDDRILADLFQQLPDVTATGYNQDEVDDIVAKAMEDIDKSVGDIGDIKDLMPKDAGDVQLQVRDRREVELDNETDEDRDNAAHRGAGRPNFRDDVDIEEVEEQPGQSAADVQAELQGLLEVKEEMLYNGKNFFQIPDLREDMLMRRKEWPDNIITWAGREATPDDGKRWFFYNYGLGGTKGLPLDRSVLAFNTHDHKFENWWEMPAYYASKLIAGGLRYSVVPDFSFYYTMPRFVHLQGVYRAQWIGRFLQEAGVRVIPRIQFDDIHSLDFNMLGIPKNPPMLTCSVQNFGTDKESKKEDEKTVTDLVQRCIDTIEPVEAFIVYGGNPGKRVLESLDLHGAEPIWVENYAAVRRGTVFDKKDGLGSKSAKERKRIREEARKAEADRLGIELDSDEPEDD